MTMPLQVNRLGKMAIRCSLFDGLILCDASSLNLIQQKNLCGTGWLMTRLSGLNSYKHAIFKRQP